jgi:glycolate oxidase
MQYKGITREIIQRLEDIAGKENVGIEEEERVRYSWDETCRPRAYLPDVVVKPRDTDTVAKVMKLANEQTIPVTPRGGGTGLSGGAVPIFGGILISLELMNRILEIDERNFVAVVEAGVTLAELHRAVESRGLYYPLYPGEESASIGGNVATNAGGMRAVKYGVTRNYVLGLEAVLPTGEVIQTGGKFVKCSTGYSLTQLLIGSEGTLAIITQVILKLLTAPGVSTILFVPFRSLSDAITAVPEIIKSKILPTGIEFMERDAIEIAERHTGMEIPPYEGEAFLLFIIDADDEEQAENISRKVGQICSDNGAIDIFVPDSERAKRRLLELREKFYPAMKAAGLIDLIDVVVPRDKIADFMERVKEISSRQGVPIIGYGHAGDGNVHLHPLGESKQITETLREIYEVGRDLGGALSGEHGIGFEKRQFLPITMDEKQIEIMKGIKGVFDPNYILNRGKVF